MGFMDRVKAALGAGGDGDGLAQRAKADRRAREHAAEELLAGRRCDGCGRRCPLADPRCARGQEARAKILARAGLR